MAFGPLQIFAFGFPSTDRFEGRIAEELVKLSDAGTIRIVDALGVFVEDDEVDVIRVSDLSEAQREELGAEMGALIGLGAAGIEGFVEGALAGEEIAAEGGIGLVEAVGADFIENLPDDSAGMLLIIEHAWAVPLREAVVDAGGVLLANQWLGAQELISLGVALGVEAAIEAAESQQESQTDRAQGPGSCRGLCHRVLRLRSGGDHVVAVGRTRVLGGRARCEQRLRRSGLEGLGTSRVRHHRRPPRHAFHARSG